MKDVKRENAMANRNFALERVSSMRARLTLAGAAAATAVVFLLTVSRTTPAHAQTDGDEKCGPDGFVLRYDKLLGKWATTGRHCADPASGPTYARPPRRPLQIPPPVARSKSPT